MPGTLVIREVFNRRSPDPVRGVKRQEQQNDVLWARLKTSWLPDGELAVYVRAFEHTGFQGGLNWFRCHSGSIGKTEIEFFAGRTIDVPSCFISGVADWGTYRKPGALEPMQTATSILFSGPKAVRTLSQFLRDNLAETSFA